MTEEFPNYDELYPGSGTGADLRAAVEDPQQHAATLAGVARDLRTDGHKVRDQAQGAPEAAAENPAAAGARLETLSKNGQFAAGLLREFSTHVDIFDKDVLQIVLDAQAADDYTGSDPVPEELHRPELKRRWNKAFDTLEGFGDDTAAGFRGGPGNTTLVRNLMLGGFIPMTAEHMWGYLGFTQDERDAAGAKALEQKLRDRGLLDGASTQRYREWLANSSRNGVSIDTLAEIITHHDIQPTDFEVLTGLERIQDGNDGKSYFLLPPDISGDDARKAVLMTYIFNAGTGYGTADGSQDNDFSETPYSADEVQRIIDRQAVNSWSYDDDVEFVHGNGGRMVTTPNGMLMGLGGNWLQEKYSANGGTTWGDIFMLNIDEPSDAAQQLRDVVQSDRSWYQNEDYNDNKPYQGSLDLDRLLHHEERHSQQWARYGYGEFLLRYGAEAGGTWVENKAFDVAEGIFGFVTGKHVDVEVHDDFEEDAGLSDGGYH